MSSRQFILIAFAAAALVTASASTLLAGSQDIFALKYRDSERIQYSNADSTDTTDGGGIIIPPIGH